MTEKHSKFRLSFQQHICEKSHFLLSQQLKLSACLGLKNGSMSFGNAFIDKNPCTHFKEAKTYITLNIMYTNYRLCYFVL